MASYSSNVKLGRVRRKEGGGGRRREEGRKSPQSSLSWSWHFLK
jgi:hypothetical protein